MNIMENEEFKILVDALKYTSNIIVDLTTKLSEQDDKINKLEKHVIHIEKLCRDNNDKIANSKVTNTNTNTNTNTKFLIDNNIQDDINYNEISDYLLKKNELVGENYNIKDLNDDIFKDKNKIDKLISSIIKRKKLLNEEHDNKDKSLLTDYNSHTINKELKDESFEFTIKTAHLDENNSDDKQNDKSNTNVETIKQIRKKINFSRRF